MIVNIVSGTSNSRREARGINFKPESLNRLNSFRALLLGSLTVAVKCLIIPLQIKRYKKLFKFLCKATNNIVDCVSFQSSLVIPFWSRSSDRSSKFNTKKRQYCLITGSICTTSQGFFLQILYKVTMLYVVYNFKVKLSIKGEDCQKRSFLINEHWKILKTEHKATTVDLFCVKWNCLLNYLLNTELLRNFCSNLAQSNNIAQHV